MNLFSSAFRHQDEIPVRHTCDGENNPPPPAWNNAPAGTRSFVLIVDDPDVPDPRPPQRGWVHWLVYNLPLPAGAQVGRNDWNAADRQASVFSQTLCARRRPAGPQTSGQATTGTGHAGPCAGETELVGTCE